MSSATSRRDFVRRLRGQPGCRGGRPGLTASLYALELEDTDAVRDFVRRTLDSARAIITDLVGPVEGEIALGDLVRTSPSTLPE